ncbi:DUF4843 domain-containing protein [Sphingobacterium psychroaquaticum]|uniref:DUF4843 domain-containing protein n=1 Tax=Sphingobacterium psychroaquaticum TaxID=561061 RepID=UPI001069D086|nr:DUF4843 domain-containing protein [Sphingobacterium psychroaquaticum]QBQ41874.1 DUF4843 domain-containing protein [Sphingobacterium psychroaquaticum]
MKKIWIYLLLSITVIMLESCEKDIMPYEGKEGVYFGVRWGDLHRAESSWPYQSYSNVDFVSIGKDVVDMAIKVDISGPVKSYDRTFYVEVNNDSTTATLGKHYEAFKREWVVPAGATSAVMVVRLMRTPDLEETPQTLGLRLLVSPDFELSFPAWDAIPSLDGGASVKKFDASLHTLRINDVMIRPAVWSGSIQAGNRESGLFGVFSRRKMEFFQDYLGLKYEDFANTQIMPMARQMLISNDGTAALVRLFNAGTPVLEDDGRLMWMGTVPWTSYIGVPWVPAR